MLTVSETREQENAIRKLSSVDDECKAEIVDRVATGSKRKAVGTAEASEEE